jgi:hypothetical protein
MRSLASSFAPLALAACATTAAAPASSGVATAIFGETVRVGSVRVTPLVLLEDSRCPARVQCVWAGQVRISAKVASRAGTQTRELALGKAVPIGAGMLVLDRVTPAPARPGAPLAKSAYRLTFRYTAHTMPAR